MDEDTLTLKFWGWLSGSLSIEALEGNDRVVAEKLMCKVGTSNNHEQGADHAEANDQTYERENGAG